MSSSSHYSSYHPSNSPLSVISQQPSSSTPSLNHHISSNHLHTSPNSPSLPIISTTLTTLPSNMNISSSASSIKSNSSSSMSELDIPIHSFETTLQSLPDKYNLMCYLPGMNANDSITVAVKSQHILHVVADKLFEAGSHYDKKVSMPCDALVTTATARFVKDGVLKITIPKMFSTTKP